MSSKKKKKTSRRRTIGESPLDSLLSTPKPSSTGKRRSKSTRKTNTSKRAASAPTEHLGAGPKVRATFHLPSELVEECRNAVVWLAAPPERLTMARLAEDALRREIERLRKKYTKGKPFPERTENLRGGRPIGS